MVHRRGHTARSNGVPGGKYNLNAIWGRWRGNLSIDGVGLDDEGIYACVILNADSTNSSPCVNVSLVVNGKGKPSFT